MAQNRRYNSSTLRFAPAIKALLLCLFLGGSAVGYVLQKNQIYELGRQIREREVQLERITWENNLRANQLAELQSSTRLAERVRQEKLDLVMPQPSQVVWLRESAGDPPSNTVTQMVER